MSEAVKYVPISKEDLSYKSVRETFLEGLLSGLSWLLVAFIVAFLGIIVVRGFPTVSANGFEFLYTSPAKGLDEGGVGPAIFGTVALVLLMTLFALPIGVLTSVYLVEYAGGRQSSRIIRAAVNNLAGVPSIVFGLFGVAFFVLFLGRGLDGLLGYSTSDPLFGKPAILWAAATMALLVLPIVIVNTEEALLAVPVSLRQGSQALGGTQWQTISRVVLPQAVPGILTGSILSISRGAGEVAPILFTGAAFLLQDLPTTQVFGVVPFIDPTKQFMELGYHIFILATQSSDVEKTRPAQYAATLVLLVITFSLNFAAIILRAQFRKRAIR
ncbi:phosphate ABC transporter permease PstA [Candidatus Cyanaurora vandensis]|uniref:phosphate ABC transporter permease PstA n=1 Tax=Candidatus Cyanaurora vandensis TaxID=2714958 RepID=UPI00257F0A84|nr:phosphate ABC transporter permease PstA [Candidatus Cyanaurora vandensis]